MRLLTALIFTGENSIVVVSGANDILSLEDVANAKSVILSSSVCVCQLEINPEVTHFALNVAKKLGGVFHLPVMILLESYYFAYTASCYKSLFACWARLP